MRDLLSSALGISVENQSRKEANRASEVMESLGWTRAETTTGSRKNKTRKTKRYWKPPEDWNCEDASYDNDF